MKFIPDEEILLNSENDLLSLKQYVSTLQEVILNVPQDIKSSFTIGLFGEWGSGKSSIVKTVEKELADQKGSIIKFIIYDAWKYANDSFRRMLLLKLQQELELDKTDLMNSFYLNEAEDVKIIKKFNWSYFLVIAVFAIIAIILVYESNISTDSKITMSIIVSILGVFLGLFKKAFDEFKVSIHKPHLFAPEQFEECFNEMTQKAFQNQSTYKKIEKWAKGKPSQKKVDKLVIVIDNIDRCQKELAYELLTNIKNFLGTNKNIIFIIPVDDDALKKHIQYSNKDENSTESNEFLRKFFNVTVRLKKLKRYDIYSFAKKINDKYLLGLNSTTIGIIGKEFASNPRRIIQLYNNLTAEFSNYDSEFINENESVICKMLILRDEWTPYYNLICRNPYLLNDPDGKTNGEIRKSDGLTNFLNKTNSVTQNVDLKVLNKILMNEDDFTGIPDSVIEGIENLDKKTLADFVEDDSIKLSLLFDFIIENLNSFIKNDRSLSTLNYFKVILILNSNQVIPNHINWRIQNEVELTLHNIVEKGCGDLNKDLVKYSEDLNLKSISYLKKFLMYQVNDEFRIDDYSKTKESSKTDVPPIK